MPQNPSQPCRECEGFGSAGLAHTERGYWLRPCLVCDGRGKVTIAEARRRNWRPIRHQARVDHVQTKLPFEGGRVCAFPSPSPMSSTRRKTTLSVAGVCNTLQRTPILVNSRSESS